MAASGPKTPASVRELATELVINPRTVSRAYQELEREDVFYLRRGLGTFVAPDIHPDRHERRALARGVAKRALTEARNNGLSADDWIAILRGVSQLNKMAKRRPSPAPRKARSSESR